MITFLRARGAFGDEALFPATPAGLESALKGGWDPGKITRVYLSGWQVDIRTDNSAWASVYAEGGHSKRYAPDDPELVQFGTNPAWPVQIVSTDDVGRDIMVSPVFALVDESTYTGPYVDSEGVERTFACGDARAWGLSPGASPWECAIIEAAWSRGNRGAPPEGPYLIPDPVYLAAYADGDATRRARRTPCYQEWWDREADIYDRFAVAAAAISTATAQKIAEEYRMVARCLREAHDFPRGGWASTRTGSYYSRPNDCDGHPPAPGDARSAP